MENKKCSICGIEKELSEYYKQKKKRKDGTEYFYYNPECKECTIARNLKWQADNPDKFKINNLRTARNFKRRNREYTREYAKKRWENGLSQIWLENNKDKTKAYSLYRSLNKTHKITKEEWVSCKEYFNYQCAYCGLTEELHKENYSQQLHKEHVDHNGANDLSNCVPSCKICNSRKNVFTLEEWYNNNDVGFNIDRLNKINKWLESDYKLYILSEITQ